MNELKRIKMKVKDVYIPQFSIAFAICMSHKLKKI